MGWLIVIGIYLTGLIIALRLADKDYKESIKEGDVIDPEAAYFWAIFWPAGVVCALSLVVLSGAPFRWIATIRNPNPK